MLTQSKLKELLKYDPDTGDFIWLAKPSIYSTKVKVGNKAGYKTSQGYISIGVHGKRYFAHRLAWLYMTGEWPESCIDHIDNIKDNNKFSNLRQASPSQNQINKIVPNTTGFRGVSLHGGKYNAIISSKGKQYYLGRFNTAEEAAKAYDEKAKEWHGKFAILNFPEE